MKVLGNGSVVQRDKSKSKGKCRDWELSVRMEEQGRKRTRTRAFHGTWTQAQAALADFRAEVADAAPPSGYTFEQYARRWHRKREESGAFAYNTMRAEGVRIGPLCREFGGMKLEEVDAAAIEGAYASWRRMYAASTMYSLHETLEVMLGEALKEGLVPSNAARDAGAPKGGRPVDRDALSAKDAERLAHALDPSNGRQLAALLCLVCGLRRGEAIALRWGDWDGESVHVERADDGKGSDKPPKTRAGVRSVPAPSWLAPVLDALRGDPSEPMCQDAWGRRLRSNPFSQWWRKYRGGFGVDCTLHELRHTYLTQLARAGVHPRVMMRLAGHDTMSVCMEVYTHVSDDMQRDAVQRAFG